MANLFPEKVAHTPVIYAYSDSRYPGCLKVGYTTRDVETRIHEQYVKQPYGDTYKIEHVESAVYEDGSTFTDHAVHSYLVSHGYEKLNGEWFRCGVDDVKVAIYAVRTRTENIERRCETFMMRPEQAEAVSLTKAYFERNTAEEAPSRPRFLWNAKMRFGKTFASYQLAKQMKMQRVLILTFKPAVQSAWREDLRQHVDFDGWQFICNPKIPNGTPIDEQWEAADKNRPIVCFGSFQDFLGLNENGGIKTKNEWVHTVQWDLIIFDEYHFGAWTERARELFKEADEEEEEIVTKGQGDHLNESSLPITADYYLYLSGTPFRALNTGEFIEEQIYNWTYSDEQHCKRTWNQEGANPYAMMPQMALFTYKVPESITEIALQGEFDEFDLNEFFKASGKGESAVFEHAEYVQKWLDLIRGNYKENRVSDLRLGVEKPPMPYSDQRLISLLTHTLWFLPNVSACHAMRNLLQAPNNRFWHNYQVVVCAGTEAGIGVKALEPVQRAMRNPLETNTITLSCGKLTTGVTVKPWSGILMLRNLKSPETYFQAAFRVQSPWQIKDENGHNQILKETCYVFDFALERSLKLIAEYGSKLNSSHVSPEEKIREFISFLPVLAYDGNAMRQVDAASILDYAMSGTTATLLARRWESALLVNVDNETLTRLMKNEAAMRALQRIEGFRNLNAEIETIINKSEAIKQKRNSDKKLTKREQKQLSDEEKEYKSKRKMIQEKLIKFATRIPVFMYLTDYREKCLQDVITQLEPELFKRVAGLDVRDFDLLVSLNVFNESLMNDAVWKFRKYEDASLEYTGINTHSEETQVGLFNTTIPTKIFREERCVNHDEQALRQ